MPASGDFLPGAFCDVSGTVGRDGAGAGAGAQDGSESLLLATGGDGDEVGTVDASTGGEGGMGSVGRTSGGIGLEGISATGATPAPALAPGSDGDWESPAGSPPVGVVVVISTPGWFRTMSRTQRSPGPLTAAPPANEAATRTMANNPLRNDGPPCQHDANRRSSGWPPTAPPFPSNSLFRRRAFGRRYGHLPESGESGKVSRAGLPWLLASEADTAGWV
jgi:hypothetical protein